MSQKKVEAPPRVPEVKARIIRLSIWQANDFALFYICTVGIRNMLRDQVVVGHVIFDAARVAQYDVYLGVVAI